MFIEVTWAWARLMIGEDLSMLLRYTQSITFDDCLEHYQKVTNQ
jgi:hypothetical protein